MTQPKYPAVSGGIGRRRFLAGAAVGAAGFALAACGSTAALDAGTTEPVGFSKLSQIVTGIDALPSDQVMPYLHALEQSGLELAPIAFMQKAGYLSGFNLQGYTGGGGPDTLEALLADPVMQEPGAQACLNAIAAAWWGGQVATKEGGQRVVEYVDAQVWTHAATWARPQTVCLGATGAWSLPGTETEVKA